MLVESNSGDGEGYPALVPVPVHVIAVSITLQWVSFMSFTDPVLPTHSHEHGSRLGRSTV